MPCHKKGRYKLFSTLLKCDTNFGQYHQVILTLGGITRTLSCIGQSPSTESGCGNWSKEPLDLNGFGFKSWEHYFLVTVILNRSLL